MDSLVLEYKKQQSIRNWNILLDDLHIKKDDKILDIGCSNGEVASLICERGASVTGIDINVELLKEAKKRNLPNAKFQNVDILNFESNIKFDGIWASYVAAYFTNLTPFLHKCSSLLKDGGWIAILEVSDFFNHYPHINEYKKEIESFYDYMYKNKYYDFKSGEKIKQNLSRHVFTSINEKLVDDEEFTSSSKVVSNVYKSWEMRLNRMKGLKQFFKDPEPFNQSFLKSLNSDEHKSNCKVHFIKAIKARTK